MIVHYMHHGQTACAKPGPPKKWKAGHMWSGDWDDVDCPRCLQRRIKRRIKACASVPKLKPTYTLEDIVKAAHKQGMKIDIKLLPKELAPTLEYLRPLLNLPADKWPGNPGYRSIVAGLDISHNDIGRVFRDNPGSQWIITPYEIIERKEFFKPPVAVTPATKPEPTPNPA
jgi:hypothetical protein